MRPWPGPLFVGLLVNSHTLGARFLQFARDLFEKFGIIGADCQEPKRLGQGECLTGMTDQKHCRCYSYRLSGPLRGPGEDEDRGTFCQR